MLKLPAHSARSRGAVASETQRLMARGVALAPILLALAAASCGAGRKQASPDLRMLGAEDLKSMLVKDKGYAFPYVVDDASGVARAFGAGRTPEAFLFNGEGKLIYHGTIDDSTYDAAKVTKPYLKSAVEALLAGKDVAETESKSVGCSIKFRPAPVK